MYFKLIISQKTMKETPNISKVFQPLWTDGYNAPRG